MMAERFYIRQDGSYIGSFIGETGMVPADAIEVSHAPAHGGDRWDFEKSEWQGIPAPEVMP